MPKFTNEENTAAKDGNTKNPRIICMGLCGSEYFAHTACSSLHTRPKSTLQGMDMMRRRRASGENTVRQKPRIMQARASPPVAGLIMALHGWGSQQRDASFGSHRRQPHPTRRVKMPDRRASCAMQKSHKRSRILADSRRAHHVYMSSHAAAIVWQPPCNRFAARQCGRRPTAQNPQKRKPRARTQPPPPTAHAATARNETGTTKRPTTKKQHGLLRERRRSAAKGSFGRTLHARHSDSDSDSETTNRAGQPRASPGGPEVAGNRVPGPSGFRTPITPWRRGPMREPHKTGSSCRQDARTVTQRL
jgi:hypothetical protein